MSDFEAYFEIDPDVYVHVTETELSVQVFGMPVVVVTLEEIAPQLDRIVETVKLNLHGEAQEVSDEIDPT